MSEALLECSVRLEYDTERDVYQILLRERLVGGGARYASRVLSRQQVIQAVARQELIDHVLANVRGLLLETAMPTVAALFPDSEAGA